MEAFGKYNCPRKMEAVFDEDKTMMLTLDIPEKSVLLSDANAWYCVLEGRPCYEYEEDVPVSTVLLVPPVTFFRASSLNLVHHGFILCTGL